jgi:ATP phosphoribosyltransferase regulatory subunit
MANWLLPEYIHDILPDEAVRIEQMRARTLESLRRSGYRLVAPPLLEYAESLLIDGSADMDLRSFKLVDQLSGRTLALRADITPQAARIDAHLLNHQGVTRLCYAGSVLHTKPAGLMRTRELLQIGAELYGDASLRADLEIQRLALQSLADIGIDDMHFDLGHVGVYRSLARRAGLSADLEQELFSVLQHKDVATLRELLAGLPEPLRAPLLALPELYGSAGEVLGRARKLLPDEPEIRAALDDLQAAANHLAPLAGEIGIDLAELRGYHYHSGMVFAVYHADSHDAIALGGRYDHLGASFGRARPATGFSLDLRQLYRLLPPIRPQMGILAPYAEDEALQQRIASLREAGEMVVVDLLGDPALRHELDCDRELVLQNGAWTVVGLTLN